MVRPDRAACKAPQAYWALIGAVFGTCFVGHDKGQLAEFLLTPGRYDNAQGNDHLQRLVDIHIELDYIPARHNNDES